MFPEPWTEITDADTARSMVSELLREVDAGHPLWGKDVIAIALGDGDDVLFALASDPECLAVVHLTWSGHAEYPGFPATSFYRGWEDFATNGMLPDHRFIMGFDEE